MYKMLLSIVGIWIITAGISLTSATAQGPLTVEISFDSTFARVNHGDKELLAATPPFIERGDNIMIQGYIYPGGTWATEEGCPGDPALPMCGAESGGGATFPAAVIGEIVCTGHFFDNPFGFFPPASGDTPQLGEEIGVFFLHLRFGSDNSNTLELRGRTITGFDGSHPAEFAVLGGTGIFKKARGEALEIMIRPNRSLAFNFEINLSGVKGVRKGALRKLIGEG